MTGAVPESVRVGEGAPVETVRALVVWLPDWPVTALIRAGLAEEGAAVAIVRANRVVACSAAARAEGVRRGQRRREAQSVCPALRLASDDPGRDQRAFLPVLARVEEAAPGVQQLRPGLCALRARGPTRYYGSEQSAAEVLLAALGELGLTDARIGVADGIFTAEQAARRAGPVRVVPAGASASFLAPLSIRIIDDDNLVSLLSRLGVQTLADFAALPHAQVRDRLGERGARLHALARGEDARPVTPRVPEPELTRQIAFEPPLELAEQVAFAVRTTADAVITALDDAGVVCTEVRVELTGDRGGFSERVWAHPSYFDAAAIVDRVRWQLESALGAAGTGEEPARGRGGAREEAGALDGGVARVRIVPEVVDDGANHRPALIGQGPDERLHHAVSRVQGVLGHRGAVTAVIGGGRWLSEREERVPWGDVAAGAAARQGDGSASRAPSAREAEPPWPGSPPDPPPGEVFRRGRSARVTSADGATVTVNERGLASAAPARLDGRPLIAWAGPWPVIERHWDPARARRAYRFQVIDGAGDAWLIVCEADGWWVEGRYS